MIAGRNSRMQTSVQLQAPLIPQKRFPLRQYAPGLCGLSASAVYGVYRGTQIFCHQIKKCGRQFDDLLMRESLALELPIKASRDGSVAVLVQVFSMWLCHGGLHSS